VSAVSCLWMHHVDGSFSSRDCDDDFFDFFSCSLSVYRFYVVLVEAAPVCVSVFYFFYCDFYPSFYSSYGHPYGHLVCDCLYGLCERVWKQLCVGSPFYVERVTCDENLGVRVIFVFQAVYFDAMLTVLSSSVPTQLDV